MDRAEGLLGLFTMLQLAGTRTKEEIKQMTLLNVDSLVRGQASYFNGDRDDDTRAYFYTYHRMFRRVIKASDFPTKSSVCFGRLIWLSRSSDIHRDLLGAPLSQQQPAHPSTPSTSPDNTHMVSYLDRPPPSLHAMTFLERALTSSIAGVLTFALCTGS
jgi:hypothetical protein